MAKTKKIKNIKRDKRLKKIKKERGWFTTLLYFALVAIAVFLLAVAVDIVVESFFITEIHQEDRDMKFCLSVYEDMGEEEGLKILKIKGREFYITDPSGKVIYENGRDTRSENEGMIYLYSYGYDDVDAYLDSEKNFFDFLPGSGVDVHWTELFWEVMEVNDGVVETTLEMDADEEQSLDRTIRMMQASEGRAAEIGAEDKIYMPFWIKLDMSDGSTFFGKAYVDFGVNELSTAIAVAISLGVVVILVVLMLIIGSIRRAIRHKRLKDFFFNDEVTGGKNWTYYLVKGEQVLKRPWNAAKKYAVVDLKFVGYGNYCLCHSVVEGNELLKKIMWGLKALVDKKEMAVHRDADKFAMLLKYDDENALEERLKNLTTKLAEVDREHAFNFQAGVCLVEPSLKNGRPKRRKFVNLEEIFNNAAMALGKFAGSTDSGVHFFDQQLKDEQKWIESVQANQQKAIDNEEFVVYYQPKYSPDTGELRGAEALIRWQSPEFGFVPPGRIIPIFEKNGFVLNIDHYMISHVARDQKRWLDAGYKCVPVSVNVSRAHFIESDLAEQIRDMVDAEGAPHEYIEIELTESAFFDDKNALLSTIERLKSYGFAVSMDDFGSGYSSLNSLKDLTLDVLKLDAEFFRGDNESERGQIVVSEAIKLAKNLNMRVVAEGIEIKDQVDFLATQGCDMIQGYYFAKPMPGEDYEKKMVMEKQDSPSSVSSGELTASPRGGEASDADLQGEGLGEN
ncbi:MAG: EAL domain-containing protein [Lachnospiraceae bacterium]|nr:EAL domain-containing protein [Lachnospiraceae bacterium]